MTASHSSKLALTRAAKAGVIPLTAAISSTPARRIAATLGIPWTLYHGRVNGMADVDRLVDMRDGLSGTSIDYVFAYYAQMVQQFGPLACQFSGDGGDKALPDLRLVRRPDSVDGFVQQKLSLSIWPISTISNILNVSEHEIVDSVRQHVSLYAEDRELWNLRFTITQRGWNWLFEGEDRNRSLVWCMTPFYTQSFFESALRVSQRLKANHRFYREFLLSLDRAVAAIPNAIWGYSIIDRERRYGSLPNLFERAWGRLGRMLKRPKAAPGSTQASPLRTHLLASLPKGTLNELALASALETASEPQLQILAAPMLYPKTVWA